MKKKIAVFGSTGSIGTQTLDVIDSRPEEFVVSALAAGKNIDRLEDQIRRYRPGLVAVGDEESAGMLKERTADLNLQIFSGAQGLKSLAGEAEYDTMVMALVGNLGLEPVMAALDRGSQIAIATKEVLVAAGKLVIERAAETGSLLLPVDSEHSAVFQCLQGEDPKNVETIILTASGGPFRQMTTAQLAGVTPQQALRHPNWQMGPKITIDSATLVNKGLEVLEAHWLFSTPLDQIQVLVHPQSIVHSMVQFADGAVMAQLGLPDMRGPIQYALLYPQRGTSSLERLDLARIGALTFEPPDFDRFPGLRLAYAAGNAGGTMPAVFNAANEVAVELFLHNGISFCGIPDLIDRVMEQHSVTMNLSLEAVLEADRWAREKARTLNGPGPEKRKKVSICHRS